MIKWQAEIDVGLFGRKVYTSKYRWKWLARLNADLYCACEMRVTSYKINKIVVDI